MISLYSGTGGSGKSLHLARVIREHLIIGKKTVIANFPINVDYISKKGKKKIGKFVYLPNDQLTVKYLMEYAFANHKAGKEGQTLVVIDEAGTMFNTRDSRNPDRMEWIHFFMTHRHYGYNFILACPFDRMIDRQIRSFFEYEVKHRKANNFRFIGFMLTIFRISLFVAVTYWYGIRERCESEFFRYRKRDSKLYDTMMLFGGEQHGKSIGFNEQVEAIEAKQETPPESADDVGGATERSVGGSPPPSSATDKALTVPYTARPAIITWVRSLKLSNQLDK